MNPAALIRLARPHQWTKNLLVFAGLLFTGSYGSTSAWLVSLQAFFGMCLLSSTFYVLNDVRDAERDRHNPRKAKRPVASGQVAPAVAGIWATLLFVGFFAVAWSLPVPAKVLFGAYGALQIWYNAGGKRVPVLDAFILGAGFVIRAAIGAAAMAVAISGWLLLCTGALALLLSFGKRRSEFHVLGEGKEMARPSLAGYTAQSLDALVLVSACGATLCYGLYAIESQTAQRHPGLVYTVVFVVYGVMRYLLISFGHPDRPSEPEALLIEDRQILVTVALFVFTAVLAMMNRFPVLMEMAR